MDLIAKPNILVNIRAVCDEDAIRVHCNSGGKLINQIGDMTGYGTVWYKITGICKYTSDVNGEKELSGGV